MQMNLLKLSLSTGLALMMISISATAQNTQKKSLFQTLFPPQNYSTKTVSTPSQQQPAKQKAVKQPTAKTQAVKAKTVAQDIAEYEDPTAPTPVISSPKRNTFKTRGSLLKENKMLMEEIDSLKKDIEQYRNDLHLNDSIRSELIDIYEENEDKSAAGLNPEDYNSDVTDSLLSMWYLHNQIKKSNEGIEYDMDSVHFSSNVPDKVFIQRLADMNSFISLPFNQTVKNYMILYSEKMPTKMGQILAVSDYYMPIFEATFSKYNLPEELKIVAIIESAMNPRATSPAGAKGMWQFMYQTAKNYGLKIDSFVDERMDPVKSVDAAARYLRDSYNIFGDWNLAISSYNCGAGNVNKAIKRSGGKRDFWSIYPFLPRETRGYVPAFVGALYATTYHKEYGIVPKDMQMPALVDTFEIHRMLHFKQINEVVGVPMEVLRNLNPQYTHDIIPGNEGTFILRIPYNYTNAFLDSEDSLYSYKCKEIFNVVDIDRIKESGPAMSYSTTQAKTTYKVRSGDYLSRVASRNGVTVSQLRQWNHLRSSKLRAGQRLIIYHKVKTAVPVKVESSNTQESVSETSQSAVQDTTKPKTSSVDTATVVNDEEQEVSKPAVTKPVKKAVAKPKPQEKDYIVYTVKKGDTLYSISKKYKGVTTNEIMKYNNISSNIHPGMKIKIPR
jgi:membrane-bound lytic murein transglycosylase D